MCPCSRYAISVAIRLLSMAHVPTAKPAELHKDQLTTEGSSKGVSYAKQQEQGECGVLAHVCTFRRGRYVRFRCCWFRHQQLIVNTSREQDGSLHMCGSSKRAKCMPQAR